MENLNQVPKIYCKKHNFAISYIKASSYDNIDNFFKCGLCVVKEENSSDCLFIEEILSSNGNQIYNYLPPLLDKKYFKEIEAALQNNIDPIQLLEEQFKDFQEQIAIKIQETKKLVISYALSQKVIDNDFLKTYEQISKIQELRFKFNDEGGNYINLGLINSQNVENELAVTYQGKAFGCNGYTKYGGEIVDGEYFWKVKQDYIVEMIINIKEKQIQFLDCSQLLSKNQLRQQGLLDPDNSYYLAIDFGTLGFEFNTSIDIIYFQEVDSC
ncbi:hypothetical protein ABPG74_004522 [Tetrahymena malaccensis]